MSNITQQILIVGVVTSACSSLGRADYNLPVFIFAFMMWEYRKFHTRLIYLLLFSFIIDFVYLIYWGIFWNQYQQLISNSDHIMHIIVVFAGILNMIIKIVIIAQSILGDDQVKYNMELTSLKDNFLNFIQFKNNDDD